MNKWLVITILGTSLTAALPAQARNVKHMLPIAVALESGDARERLDGSVKVFFGPQAHPATVQRMSGSEVRGKGAIANGADIPACNSAFVDALSTLQKHAKESGANAVVNIVSFYRKSVPVSSATEFECHAGRNSAGLELRGEFVRIADK